MAANVNWHRYGTNYVTVTLCIEILKKTFLQLCVGMQLSMSLWRLFVMMFSASAEGDPLECYQCQCQSEIFNVARIAELLRRSPRRRSRVTELW